MIILMNQISWGNRHIALTTNRVFPMFVYRWLLMLWRWRTGWLAAGLALCTAGHLLQTENDAACHLQVFIRRQFFFIYCLKCYETTSLQKLCMAVHFYCVKRSAFVFNVQIHICWCFWITLSVFQCNIIVLFLQQQRRCNSLFLRTSWVSWHQNVQMGKSFWIHSSTLQTNSVKALKLCYGTRAIFRIQSPDFHTDY